MFTLYSLNSRRFYTDDGTVYRETADFVTCDRPWNDELASNGG